MSSNRHTLFVELKLISKQFGSGFEGALSKMKRLGDLAESAGRRITTGVTLPTALLGARAFDSAVSMDRLARQAAQIAGSPTAAALKQITDEAVRLGDELPFTSIEIAEGMVAATRATDSLSKAINLNRVAAKLATNQNISLADSTQFLGRISANLGVPVDDLERMERLADVLATAANNAPVEGIAELFETIKEGGATAGLAGFDQLETIAALTTLAGAGLVGTKAGTGIKAIVTQLEGMADAKKAAFESRLGLGQGTLFDEIGKVRSLSAIISAFNNVTTRESRLAAQAKFNELVKQGVSRSDAMAAASKELEKGQIDLAEAFATFNLRGGPAIGILTAQEETYQSLLQKLRSADGIVDTSFITAADSIAFQFDKLTNKVQAFFIELFKSGSPAADVFKEISAGIGGMVDWFRSLSPETQRFIVQTTALVAASGPLLLLSGLLANSFGALFSIFVTMLSPAGIAAAAVFLLLGKAVADAMESTDKSSAGLDTFADKWRRLVNWTKRFMISFEQAGLAATTTVMKMIRGWVRLAELTPANFAAELFGFDQVEQMRETLDTMIKVQERQEKRLAIKSGKLLAETQNLDQKLLNQRIQQREEDQLRREFGLETVKRDGRVEIMISGGLPGMAATIVSGASNDGEEFDLGSQR